MAALGTSLIVFGLALLCSGPIFLLPTSRLRGRTGRATLDDSEDRAPSHLQQRRQERR